MRVGEFLNFPPQQFLYVLVRIIGYPLEFVNGYDARLVRRFEKCEYLITCSLSQKYCRGILFVR